MKFLAEIYLFQERLKEAMELILQCIEDMERLLGPDHPNTLYCKNILALCFKKDNRLDEAIALMKKVVRSRTRVLGPDHPDTLASVNHLDRWLKQDVEKSNP